MPLNLGLQAESQAMLRALSHAKGNVSQAANLPGIMRPTFYALAKKKKLDVSQNET